MTFCLQKVKSQDNGNGAKENGKGRDEKQKTESEGVKRDRDRTFQRLCH